MFQPLPPKFSFPEAEERVMEFWEKHKVFELSLEQRRGAERFVFYEGPPTANGLPHPGHCLTRAMKDLFPRYQTMCGKLVERKAGWDTHGLPVEVEVCKELGIHTKQEIESFGVENFVHKCIQSVFKYVQQWEHMTRRLGFWVNLEEAYVTFHQSYVESVWWGLKTLFERGLLYQGHKVVWWWAQGGTALSAGEVGEGYRTVQDPSVYIRFPVVPDSAAAAPNLPEAMQSALKGDKRVSLLVWTTTPWTLLSNHFAAVGPDIDYALIFDKTIDEYLVIASALVGGVADKLKHDFEVVTVCKGTDLVGLRYEPPFDCFHAYRRSPSKAFTLPSRLLEQPDGATAENAALGETRNYLVDRQTLEYVGWRVIDADFVEIATGTGIVHIAPAYGEVDFDRLQEERDKFIQLSVVPLLNAVEPNGTFASFAPEAYRGRWVKDCDPEIIRELKDRKILLHQETIEHEYPFCPRAEDDPLIQYARKSWFVRTSEFKDEFLKNNEGIDWLPDHIREGRFGDFLRNNVDWALSRERYWGTPLPIWRCENCGNMEAIGSLAELQAKPGATDGGLWKRKKAEDPAIPDHLQVHKPYIDEWTYDAPCCDKARMSRVPEVIDCWWDAGSMPFAQWGFPHVEGSIQTFIDRFPANFISEALDQTRGWFYGMLAISTLLFGERRDNVKLPGNGHIPDPRQGHPYKACIVLGLMMGEDGLKMSKRKKNYREPTYVFDHYGADAMRWFLFSGQTPWTSVRFEEHNIRDAHREFLVRLYNVFSFFNIYANIDGFTVESAADAANAAAKATGWRPVPQRSELDRWILGELQRTTAVVRENLDRFENHPAAGRLNEFVDALSNWYVRRSRPRFWRSEKDQDKWDGYNTLYEVLVDLSKLIAPFTPFFSETLYQNLVAEPAGRNGSTVPVSVHLCDYPVANEKLIDPDLAQEMDLVRQIVSLGHAARTAAKLKVRQPLAQVEIILVRQEHAAWLREHAELIAEELNIKQVDFTTEADQYVTYRLKPEFKAIGPKYGKLAPKVAAALNHVDAAEARKTLAESGELTIDVDGQPTRLTENEVHVRLEARSGWSATQGRGGVVVVKTELTAELRDEGLCREFIHHVQTLRKAQDLPYEARITLYLQGPAPFLDVVRRYADTIQRECLAARIEYDNPPEGADLQTAKVEGNELKLGVIPEAGQS